MNLLPSKWRSALVSRRASGLAVLLWLTACAGCRDGAPAPPDAGPCDASEAPVPRPVLHTPRWAFEPWISKDISSARDTRDFVRGFRERDIPVGVVVLDSPWETHYNTFVPNPTRYPELGNLVADLRAQGVRTVLWITQMVNEVSYDLEAGGDTYAGASPNFAQAQACGFLVDRGATHFWWKGKGAGIDFFNPAARAWWHRQQDAVLDLGVAGWKLDFGEEYLPTEFLSAAGPVSRQIYSEAYYEDFLAYGQHRLGLGEFVTMVRAYDRSYGFRGRFFARREHAPVVWAGDNRRDWVGLVDALDHMFRSADAGYAVIGSDIGGYLDVDDEDLLGPKIPFDQEVFARWTAIGALSPFMQLHGRANLEPWNVPERAAETLAIYRYWSKLHHELVPFFYSLSATAHAGGANVVRPVPSAPYPMDDWRYQLGDALLVAPIVSAGGRRDVLLPGDPSITWFDWWSGASHSGGSLLPSYDASDRSRVPLFVRSGALIPLEVSDGVTGIGSPAHAGHLTVLAWPPAVGTRSFRLLEADDSFTELYISAANSSVTFGVSRARRPLYVRVRAPAAAQVTLAGSPLPSLSDKAALDVALTGWARAGDFVWVKLTAEPGAREVTLE